MENLEEIDDRGDDGDSDEDTEDAIGAANIGLLLLEFSLVEKISVSDSFIS